MWLLMAVAAWGATPAEQAWNQLARGDVEGAYAQTNRTWASDPAMAYVRVEAEKRLFDPRRSAATCTQIMGQLRGPWADRPALAKSCGWAFVASRTAPNLAAETFAIALKHDAWDAEARSGRQAAAAMDPMPTRKWAPPPPSGQMRARRKRDFQYLYRYLRPEDGAVTVAGQWTALPASRSAQSRESVRLDLFLRPHEHVIAAWRGTQAHPPTDGAPAARPSTHQLHGGYRLTVWPSTPLQLDGSLVLGKGRDEGAIRFRAERIGLGEWSADVAAVVSPWGTHGALRLGWKVEFEGIVTTDLRIEGQAGAGDPRVLGRLALERYFQSVLLRLDGQIGKAARPLDDRFLITDLPGLEGAGAELSLEGKLAKRWWARGGVGVKRLHNESSLPSTSVLAPISPTTAGQLGLSVRRTW